MDEIKKQTNFEINQVISQPYKYGFKAKQIAFWREGWGV